MERIQRPSALETRRGRAGSHQPLNCKQKAIPKNNENKEIKKQVAEFEVSSIVRDHLVPKRHFFNFFCRCVECTGLPALFNKQYFCGENVSVICRTVHCCLYESKMNVPVIGYRCHLLWNELIQYRASPTAKSRFLKETSKSSVA